MKSLLEETTPNPQGNHISRIKKIYLRIVGA